jgi:hypothetical protein
MAPLRFGKVVGMALIDTREERITIRWSNWADVGLA